MSIPGKQTINVGLPNESANSDSLYTAFTKTEQNFTNLFACASPYNTFTAGPGILINANSTLGTVSITNQGVTNIVAGDNIVINQSNGNVTISSTGSGNGGALSSVGINPVSNGRLVVTNSPLVTNGNINIDLASSGVTGGTYSNPTLTVDNYGRITSAANGNIAGTVTSIGLTAGSGIQVSGGPITSNGNITVTNTGVTRINPGTGISVTSGNGEVTISATTLGGTVTAVGISSDQLVVAGSPVVSSGTISVNLPANVSFNNINANGGNINGNLVITGNISPAANNKVGGIKPGPGVDISLDGELTIDTANLPLSFGNFTANNNVLSIVNVDENMILQTEGNAEIQLVGNIGFYKPDGLPPNVANRYFSATSDGQIQILVPNSDPLAGAVNIIGSTSGNVQAPINTGVMLQITGQNNDESRLYLDGAGGYAGFIGRRYEGNATTPTQVLDGQEISRHGINGYTSNGWLSIGQARISFVSTDNQDAANNGAKIEFWTTPKGNTVANRAKTLELDASYGANIIGRLSVTGNANVGNIGTASGIFTANVTVGNVYANSGTIGASIATISGNANVGNLLSSGAITSNSATAGVGYRTGAGGTVTQLTDKTTAVTLNKLSGEITMSNSTLGGDATVSFTLNNSTIANTDVIIINQVSTANRGEYAFDGTCNTGNAIISVHNMTNTNRSDAIVIRYAVIKAAIT